jgi:hypothetical protein
VTQDHRPDLAIKRDVKAGVNLYPRCPFCTAPALRSLRGEEACSNPACTGAHGWTWDGIGESHPVAKGPRGRRSAKALRAPGDSDA